MFWVIIYSAAPNMISKLLIAIFSFVLLYFSYVAINMTPLQLGEVDSLTYHVPLAESFANGEFNNLLHIPQGLGYYPGVGEVLLSFVIKLGVPLGFFNILSVALLFLVLRKLGRTYKLNRDYSNVFAASVCLLPSILRLVPTQKIDIWLAVSFVYIIVLIKNHQKTLFYYLKLGIAIGVLIGIKYSGILIATGLCIVFAKSIWSKLNIKRFFCLISPVLIIGGYWYLRNYLLFNNPIFPLGFLIFAPHPDFTNIVWTSLTNAILATNGIFVFLQAYVSEFLLWSITPLIIFYSYFYSKKEKISNTTKEMGFLSFFLFLFLLPLPAGPFYQSAVSFMRFVFPLMIVLILQVFLFASKTKNLKTLGFLAFLSSVAVLPQLNYYPKLIMIWLILMCLGLLIPMIRKI